MTMPGAWCLVLPLRAACPKRQPGGSPDTLRECVCACAWTVDRMPHEPGSPDLQCACAVIKTAKSGKQHGTAVEGRKWALAICRDGTLVAPW